MNRQAIEQMPLLDLDEDIRDFESGETYYAIADRSRGGRCVMKGMFIAAWRNKTDAQKQASYSPHNFTVVKCLKP